MPKEPRGRKKNQKSGSRPGRRTRRIPTSSYHSEDSPTFSGAFAEKDASPIARLTPGGDSEDRPTSVEPDEDFISSPLPSSRYEEIAVRIPWWARELLKKVVGQHFPVAASTVLIFYLLYTAPPEDLVYRTVLSLSAIPIILLIWIVCKKQKN